MHSYLTNQALADALNLRDLSDPDQGPHAMQVLLHEVVGALAQLWDVQPTYFRASPLVAVEDNYDRLGFDGEDVTRSRRYTRYLSPTVMLRSHTSAAIPWLLRTQDTRSRVDQFRVLPGLVYRRDSIDRTHVGAPHQLDLWRTSNRTPLLERDLTNMLATLVEAVLPATRWRAIPATHPYTINGQQLDVLIHGEWLELAECGLVAPTLLRRCGLNPQAWSGLALGMGLDRALMLRKGIDDIRVLRSDNPQIQAQMFDLSPWRPVSSMPRISRDISIVIDRDEDDETLGDAVRTALEDQVEDLESVAVIARTPYTDLPPAAQARLGLTPDQENALVRILLRPLGRTLTDRQANELRDKVYLAVHRGPTPELITSPNVSPST